MSKQVMAGSHCWYGNRPVQSTEVFEEDDVWFVRYVLGDGGKEVQREGSFKGQTLDWGDGGKPEPKILLQNPEGTDDLLRAVYEMFVSGSHPSDTAIGLIEEVIRHYGWDREIIGEYE